jgi:geranylgeranyl reductase family protein
MMKRERDVIVVGAGPAGATTATILAQKGYDVLLLDRASFPRDKTCGDAVPADVVNIMYRLGMEEKVKAAEARGELYPLTHMLLVSPKRHSLQAEFRKGELGTDSYVAPRYYFDALIQEHAVASGAEFRQARVTGPVQENGRVTGVKARVNGSTETLSAKVVVGADGVTSSIARALRPKSEQHVDAHRAVALRAYIDDLKEEPHQVEFYLYDEFLPGYAWVFPTGKNQANIGLGMRLDHFRDRDLSLEDMLHEFLQMPAIEARLLNGGELRDVATWQLNFGSQKGMRYVYDGALLVGDAAGFINPLTGGGIHNSMVSAELASYTIDQAVQSGDMSYEAMRAYEQRCHEAMWDNMRRSFALQRMLYHVPPMVDFLVRWMGVNNRFAKTFLDKL